MKIEDIFHKLKPLAGKDIDLLWQEYILADPKTRKTIEDSLRIILAQNLNQTFEEKDILLEPPPQDIAQGEYPLGMVYYGREGFHPFGLREREWVQHVGVFGRSGSGKTNTAFIVVLNFLRKGKPFLVFDWKRNYRDLLSLVGKEILVFTVGRDISPFYFNPLRPPSKTPPTIWLKKIIEIMCHSYFLGEGVAYLLQKAIDSLYREYGVYEGSETYPNLSDVRDWLYSYKAKGREASWMDSAVRAVGVLCFGEVGRVFNQRADMPLDKLLEKNVILELDALTNSDKTFFIESLLLWIHHYRMSQKERERFKHAIIIEEAHHILLRRKQEIMGEEAVTDIILREIRELGEAIVLIDQHPSLISKPALGNTYCTIAMNLKHRSDITMIAESLLLDTNKARYLGKLETGFAMVKLQGRWFEPFLVRFPLVRIKKGSVTDERLKRFMAGFWEEMGVFREEKGILESKGQVKEVFRAVRGEGKKEGISPIEKALLRDIIDNAFSSTSERYERLGLNSYQGNKAREALLNKGLIEVKDLPIPKGRIRLLRLTEKGHEAARSLGLNPNPSHRKGGIEHEYWKRRIAEHYRKRGYRVIMEYPLGRGKSVDLVAKKDGKSLAIEIETGKSEAVYNIKKNLKAGFDGVIVVALNKRLKDRLLHKVSGLGDSRVRVSGPEEFG